MTLDDIDLDSIEYEITGRHFDDPQVIINYAEDKHGDPLSEDQLDSLNDSYVVQDFMADLFYRGEL